MKVICWKTSSMQGIEATHGMVGSKLFFSMTQ